MWQRKTASSSIRRSYFTQLAGGGSRSSLRGTPRRRACLYQMVPSPTFEEVVALGNYSATGRAQHPAYQGAPFAADF